MKVEIVIRTKEPYVIEKLLSDSNVHLSLSEILNELTFFLKKHYSQFGSKPYILEYDALKGYILRSNSDIGKISTFNFEIILNPKFENLSIGKCIGMSQFTSSSLLKVNSNDVVNELFSEKFEYSTIEYLTYGLIDSVLSISSNGLAKTYIDVVGESNKLGGSIKFQESINNGSFNPPLQDIIESEYNILPNIIIRHALLISLNSCTSTDLKKLINKGISIFEKVTNPFEPSFLENSLFYYFNLPRADYEKAIVYAKAIIDGGLLGGGGENLNIPSITMNLDQLFEEYVSKYIHKILNPARYIVSCQYEIKHSVIPPLKDKKLILDLFIEDIEKDVSFVIDLKNKYSELEVENRFKINNQDIFQVHYYAQTVDTKYTFLLYPSTKPSFQFPIKSSEGQKAYDKKVSKSLEQLNEHQLFTFLDGSFKLIIYHIDLSGSLHNTNKSIASFCQMLNYIENNEIN